MKIASSRSSQRRHLVLLVGDVLLVLQHRLLPGGGTGCAIGASSRRCSRRLLLHRRQLKLHRSSGSGSLLLLHRPALLEMLLKEPSPLKLLVQRHALRNLLLLLQLL